MSKDNTLQQLEYFVKTYGNEVCGLIPIQVIKNAVRDIRIEKERGDDLYREHMDMIEHYPHCDGILQKETLHWLNKWKEQVTENERLTEDVNIWQDRFKEQVEETDELKAENERLSLIAGMVDKGIAVEIVNMQETIDKQKAEIERLTEENNILSKVIGSSKRKTRIYELQKQVDELKARDMSEMIDLFNCETDKLIEKNS